MDHEADVRWIDKAIAAGVDRISGERRAVAQVREAIDRLGEDLLTTHPTRRERIATAALAALMNCRLSFKQSELCEEAVSWADSLIKVLDRKPEGA